MTSIHVQYVYFNNYNAFLVHFIPMATRSFRQNVLGADTAMVVEPSWGEKFARGACTVGVAGRGGGNNIK